MALTLLSPVIIIVALLLAIFQNGKVFFTQKRPGRNARIFLLLKFKTMRDDFDANGNLLPDKDRLTAVGRFVRKTSLDELPQLVNIIAGDMSFVGPRPLLEEYLNLYNDEQMKRHLVTPGISGWAQVNGRNSIDWPTKFKLDVWYVNNQSFWLDIKILLLTIKKVFVADGINASGSATIEKFKGN